MYIQSYALRGIVNELRYISFKRGQAVISEKSLIEIKQSFYKTLNSERAIKIQALHDEVFEKLDELMKMIRQKHSLALFTNLFELDRDWNLKKANIDYNSL